ncbi:hypothetical protein NUW58_g8704 [Xylaria curta]|uniref:Uncharacterized protein n=1 Tax=Xylaria curta TaxID=42375 RepID=A0ACC1N741_9PEZI|nr:hypothetical protein NUW58_g8704 [Xylaria curta]
MRVTNAVAELRRMNSQVSCVSAHSTATTNITSPTLPALRGGGCSPGKKGATGGAKNYLSLGSSPSREKEGECDYVGNKKPDAGGWRHRNGQNEEKMIPVNTREEATVESRSKGPEGGIAVWNGGVGRPRGNTVVESFEQDLDRARQVFRKSRG